MFQSWADGINFHGGHKYGLVEGCEISYTGDDLYAVWPQSTARPGFEGEHDPRDCSNHIIFRDNIGRYPLRSLSRKSVHSLPTLCTMLADNSIRLMSDAHPGISATRIRVVEQVPSFWHESEHDLWKGLQLAPQSVSLLARDDSD